MHKTVSQALQEGRARIAAGWCQGEMHVETTDGQDQYCAYGALWWPAWEYGDMVVGRTVQALFQALPAAWGSLGLFAYNDDPATTQADILALYDRALTAVTK